MKYIPNGNIFDQDVECIINPVNCQAHKLQDGWQKGLAGVFEERFPSIQPPFKKACREGTLKPGGVQLIRIDSKTGERSRDGDRLIANVATKDHWSAPSRIEWVDDGLRKLAGAIEARGIKSVAIPQLGAGFGKLQWKDVRKSVEKHFGPLSEKGVSVVVLGEGPVKGRDHSTPAAAPVATAPRLAIEEPADAKYIAGIGARDTPAAALTKMREVSKIMAAKGHILRSGGAIGADDECEKGWDEAGGKKQIFLSWKGMNDRQPDGKQVFCFNYGDGTPETEIAKSYYRRSGAKPNGDEAAWARLGRGGKAHMSRNTNQVLGPNIGKSPQTNAILCWTKGGQIVGGTGQALRIAEDKGIPVINLGDPKLKGLSAEQIASFSEQRMDGKTADEAVKQAWSEKRKKSADMER